MPVLEERLTEMRLAKASMTTADLGGAGESPLSMVQAKGPCPSCGRSGGRHGRSCAISSVAKAVAESPLAEEALVKSAERWLEPIAKSAPADKTPEPFSQSKTSNWVARQGGLPNYIQHVAHALVEKGKTVSRAIQMAIGIVRNWAEGKGNVSPAVRAAAAKAIAEFEAKAKAARAS